MSERASTSARNLRRAIARPSHSLPLPLRAIFLLQKTMLLAIASDATVAHAARTRCICSLYKSACWHSTALHSLSSASRASRFDSLGSARRGVSDGFRLRPRAYSLERRRQQQRRAAHACIPLNARISCNYYQRQRDVSGPN